MTNTGKQATTRARKSGQTLIIAMIVMGVLLMLGIAFTIIVGGAVNLSGESRKRELANDFAKGGIEVMHERMLNSSADAPFLNTTPPNLPDVTKDPDAMYLRPASGFTFPSASGNVIDLGGPDGLGPYARFDFDLGRALVRVRYAPSDYDAFADPSGALKQPGRARRYLIIESVGRPGRISPNDPTQLLNEAVRIRFYANAGDLAAWLQRMHDVDSRILPSRKMMAFATIGIGDDAMTITDIHNTDKPAELGFPTPGAGGTVDSVATVGAYYLGNPVNVPVWFGQAYAEPNSGLGNGWRTVPGHGGIRSNTSIVVHGQVNVAVNAGLGEGVYTAGEFSAANDGAQINVTRHYYDRNTDLFPSDWQGNPSTVVTPFVLNANTMDSDNPAFDTIGNVVRDGEPQPDVLGYPRWVRVIEAPRIDRVDQQGRDQYYVEITRNSGPVVNGRNIGQFGYGAGVYVDYMNPYNLQRRNENERDVNASNSLVDLWFQPNARDNTTKAGSWEGPYFVADACYLRFIPDGFVIIRPGNSGEQQSSESAFWRDPFTGASTGESSCRFRLRTIAGQTWILNSVVSPNLVGLPAASLNDTDFTSNGMPFQGVIYFEGDVRVRGVIPTHQQVTVLSMGNIYIDGSITKGVVTEFGGVISEPSRSMLSLLARDNVAVNTTQFFAPVPNDLFDTKDDSPLPDTPTPIELGVTGDAGVDSDVLLQLQLLLMDRPDPGTPGVNPFNPLTWEPYATSYASWTGINSVGPDIDVFLMLVASANDSGPSYVSLGIQPQTYAGGGAAVETAYLFSRLINFASAGAVTFNAADPFFAPGPKIPVYGLADPNVNVFPKFETVQFPLVGQANWNYSNATRRLVPLGGNPEGLFELAVSDESLLRLRNNAIGSTGQKEFLVARTAVTPHDVRIEASVYAQYGSFYVIPGPWFNMNTDDTRARFLADVANVGLDEAQRLRFERFGNTPQVPFANEPIDCKVTLIGAISQNLPAPISRQAEWLQKWGWIPRDLGGTGLRIPWQHVPAGYDINTQLAVPNFVVIHDPALAGASADGVNPLRTDPNGRTLPPTPRLPVSPTLVYFGEVN